MDKKDSCSAKARCALKACALFLLLLLGVHSALVVYHSANRRGAEPPRYERIGDLISELQGIDSWPVGSFPCYRSGACCAIVRMGAEAIPDLVLGLEDNRPTRVVFSVAPTGRENRVVEISFACRYRHKDWRQGSLPSKDAECHANSERYTLTVSDICFFLLGEIVNRPYSPVEKGLHLPTICVTSPTVHESIRELATKEWARTSGGEHLKLLADDLNCGALYFDAIERLWYFDPGAAERETIRLLRRKHLDRSPITESIYDLDISNAAAVVDARARMRSRGLDEGFKLCLIEMAYAKAINRDVNVGGVARALFDNEDATKWHIDNVYTVQNLCLLVDALAYNSTDQIDRELGQTFDRIVADKSGIRRENVDVFVTRCLYAYADRGILRDRLLPYCRCRARDCPEESDRTWWQDWVAQLSEN